MSGIRVACFSISLDGFVKRGFENVGARILGRNMFGPVRGPWPDESWRGWWGEAPPYHVPVFALTHHARPSLEAPCQRERQPGAGAGATGKGIRALPGVPRPRALGA